MSSRLIPLLALVILANLSLAFARADDAASTTETRLRQALRDTTLQLRDAQNQVVTIQAAKDQVDKDDADQKTKVDGLASQLSAVTKQSADDKASADKSITDLNSQITDLNGQVARLNQALGEWKGAYKQVAQLATDKEAARVKLAVTAALLQRTVDDRENKNIELYKTGSEILARYEKFGLGDAIGAKEPFVGLSRVKLENLVQGYKDELLNQTVISGQPPDLPPAHPTAQAAQSSTSPEKPPART